MGGDDGGDWPRGSPVMDPLSVMSELDLLLLSSVPSGMAYRRLPPQPNKRKQQLYCSKARLSAVKMATADTRSVSTGQPTMYNSFRLDWNRLALASISGCPGLCAGAGSHKKLAEVAFHQRSELVVASGACGLAGVTVTLGVGPTVATLKVFVSKMLRSSCVNALAMYTS